MSVESQDIRKKIAVVGAGVAGTVAALRARELGLRFSLLEAERPERTHWEVQWAFGRFLADRGDHEGALEHLRLAHRFEPAENRLGRIGIRYDLGATLLATGDKTMVEASPYDRIWGVGLRADDSRVHDRERWRGLNLLGEALMQVREQLRAQDS